MTVSFCVGTITCEMPARYTEKEGGDGMMSAEVRPYLMDLGSTNGSFLNGERIESQRYYELYEKVFCSEVTTAGCSMMWTALVQHMSKGCDLRVLCWATSTTSLVCFCSGGISFA